MRYIRTKYKIYECAPFEELDEQDKKCIESNHYSSLYDYQKEDVFVKVNWEVKPFYKIQPIKLFNIVKSADTIEELCDDFVIVFKEGDKLITYGDLERARDFFYGYTGLRRMKCIYGAIWTDKGLIYVAKMKGVLPNGEIDWELL